MMTLYNGLAKLESAIALEILCNLEQYRSGAISTAPVSPKSGDLYLFITDQSENKDNWKYDNMKWINNSSRSCTKCNLSIKLHYFTINIGYRIRGLFFKQVYSTRIEDTFVSLLYYHGENEDTNLLPEMEEQIHSQMRTSTSLMEKEGELDNDIAVYHTPEKGSIPTPHNMRSIILDSPSNMIDGNLMTPRASIPMETSQCALSSKLRQIHVASLHELADTNPRDIYLVVSIPKLIVLFGNNDLLHEYRHLLRTQVAPADVVLNFSNIIKLEQFNITPLYINYFKFAENPSFPVLHLLHESCSQQVYNTFFNELVEIFPELYNDHYSIMVPSSTFITKTVKKILPNLQIIENSINRLDFNNGGISKDILSSVNPVEFVQNIIEDQKVALAEISKSYKSNGMYHLHNLQKDLNMEMHQQKRQAKQRQRKQQHKQQSRQLLSIHPEGPQQEKNLADNLETDENRSVLQLLDIRKGESTAEPIEWLSIENNLTSCGSSSSPQNTITLMNSTHDSSSDVDENSINNTALYRPEVCYSYIALDGDNVTQERK